MHASASDVAAALVPHARVLVAELFPSARFDPRHARMGAIDGHPGNSLVVHLAGPRAGRWKDFQIPAHRGDLLDLVAHARCGGDIGRALAWAREFLRLPPDPSPTAAPPARHRRQDTDTRPAAARLWNAGSSEPQPPAVAYFQHRRLPTLPRSPNLRYLADAWHPFAQIALPAILARVDALDGAFLGVHRIYLTPEGALADLAPPKLSLGAIAGGAIRLGSPAARAAGATLYVAEGLEDALSISAAFPDAPVWAVTGAGHYAGLDLPPAAARVVAAHDNDEAGRDNIARLAERHPHRPFIAPVAAPETDWNDALAALGPPGVRDALRT